MLNFHCPPCFRLSPGLQLIPAICLLLFVISYDAVGSQVDRKQDLAEWGQRPAYNDEVGTSEFNSNNPSTDKATADIGDTDGQPTVLDKTFSWIVEERNTWSTRIGNMGRRIDGFFADIDAENTANDSFLKLGLFNVWRKVEGIGPDPRFRFRLDLPYTKEKLKLVIENEPDETVSLEEKNRSNVLRKDETTEASSTGFLRLLGAFRNWNLRNDLGVRIRNPIDPFARGRATKSWRFRKEWVFRLDETLSYFNSEGLAFTSAAYFEKDVSDDLFFRSKTEAQWLKTRDGWEFAQTFSVSHIISVRTASVYRLGWFGESRPMPRTRSCYANFTVRHKLFSDWLFFEITPELLFPRDDNFKPNPSLTFGIEMIFSE